MSSISNVTDRVNDSLRTAGKISLNANYPDEFELYLFAFELLDGAGKTMEYFIFPVNPSSFKQSDRPVENIQKTMSGVAVISNQTFTPKQITINGNFGRRLKFLIGKNTIGNASKYVNNQINTFKKTKKFNTGKVTLKDFDANVKTGYGCFKILMRIVNESRVVDDGKPRTLLFYNLALNESYVVRVNDISSDMSQDTNMIWQYILQMTAIAPAESFVNDFRKSLSINQFTQQRAQDVFKFVNKFVNSEDLFRNSALFKVGKTANSLSGIYNVDGPGRGISSISNLIFG